MGIPLFASLPDKLIYRLQKVHNSAVYIITYMKAHEQIMLVFHRLHWLPVREHIKFKVLTLTPKALHGQVLQYLGDLIQPYHPARMLCLVSQTMLKVLGVGSSYGEHMFS